MYLDTFIPMKSVVGEACPVLTCWLCFNVVGFQDPKTPDHVHLKVGRAINLVKRIDEWGKQCGSKEVILRGYWPGSEQDGVMVKGMVSAGKKGKHCHRLERA
jgi:hypothetical protein